VIRSKGAIEGTNETFQAPKVIQKIRLGWVEVDVQSQRVLHCICYKMIVHSTFQEGAQHHDNCPNQNNVPNWTIHLIIILPHPLYTKWLSTFNLYEPKMAKH
jgi:hypothetical protein